MSLQAEDWLPLSKDRKKDKLSTLLTRLLELDKLKGTAAYSHKETAERSTLEKEVFAIIRFETVESDFHNL